MKKKVDEINRRSLYESEDINLRQPSPRKKRFKTNFFDKNLKVFNGIILGHDFK